MSNKRSQPPDPTIKATKGSSRRRLLTERIEGLFSGLERPPAIPDESLAPPPLTGDGRGLTPRHSEPSAPESPPLIEAAAPHTRGLVEPPSQPAVTPPPSTPSLTLPQQGIQVQPAPEGEQTLPAAQPLTPLPYESLRQGRPIAIPASDSQPAVLAYGKPLGRQPASEQGSLQTLLLEVLDDNPQRRWSEDELLLVEQVSDQLSLALENARLFEEARLRNEELSTINRIISVASQTLEFDHLLTAILQSVMGVIEYESGLISLAESSEHQSEPTRLYLAVHNNLPSALLQKLTSEGLEGTVCDLVYRWGQCMHVPDLSKPPAELRASYPDPQQLEAALQKPQAFGFRSYLGAPLVSKGVRLGTICLFSTQVKPIPQPRIALIEAIGQQVGVLIENTRLFEQTQRARDALQISERYQKNVAQAVAALTERGIAALGEVLELLGQASQCSRVHYLETYAERSGIFWRVVNEWRNTQVDSQLTNPLLRRYPIPLSASWLNDLRRFGYAQINAHELPPQEREALQAQGTFSRLILAVAGRHEIPGCLVFDECTAPRRWNEDEIAALRVAASALANTIARDDLFAQLQANLAETEAQYQASARLNAANTYEDILNVLRQHTILGHINALNLALALFDRPGTRNQPPSLITPVAQWASRNAIVPQLEELSLREESAFLLLLDPEHPTTVVDAASDPRLDDETRRLFAEKMGARSLLFAPLNVSGRWIGHLIGLYGQITGFPEHEVRRLASLAGQAAVALESLRLLEETRQRNEELNLLNQVISAVSRTLDLESILSETLQRVLQALDFSSGMVSIADPESGTLSLAVHHNLPPAMINLLNKYGLANTFCDLVYRFGKTLYIPDLSRPSQEALEAFPAPELLERALQMPRKLGFRSYLGVPLISKGQRLGTVSVFSSEERRIPSSRLALTEAIGQQVGVAIENARAYALTQKAMEEIREADRLKTQFLANMSHELRTPLNSIIGFSRVILKGIDGPITEQQQQDLTAIYNAGQHLLGLINDVLDLSRIEAGKMELNFEENVNLGDIIRSVMSTTIGLVKDKPIQLHQNISPDLPLLTIDSMKIRQVLLNLLSNAAKFTEEGSITVEAEPLARGEQVIVRVKDTGPGIAPEHQERLFQPFSQVDGSLTRKSGGSGLGLSICHHLVRMHGGTIGVESELGKGSTFYFILPVKQPQERLRSHSDEDSHPSSEHAQANSAMVMLPTSASRTEEKPAMILAVESEPQLIDLYRRYVTKHNFTVVGLTELNQVLSAATNMQPFAITLDVSMSTPPSLETTAESPAKTASSAIDGWQVLEQLQREAKTKHIPIIVCSLVDERERAFRLGASDYLLKPILEEDLIQALERLRSGHSSRQS